MNIIIFTILIIILNMSNPRWLGLASMPDTQHFSIQSFYF
jgi:hypothetical protein